MKIFNKSCGNLSVLVVAKFSMKIFKNIAQLQGPYIFNQNASNLMNIKLNQRFSVRISSNSFGNITTLQVSNIFENIYKKIADC